MQYRGCNKKDFDPVSEAGFDEETVEAEKSKIYKAFNEYEEDFIRIAQFIDTRDEDYIELEIGTESVSKKSNDISVVIRKQKSVYEYEYELELDEDIKDSIIKIYEAYGKEKGFTIRKRGGAAFFYFYSKHGGELGLVYYLSNHESIGLLFTSEPLRDGFHWYFVPPDYPRIPDE